MNYDFLHQRDPGSDPRREKFVFYFGAELDARLKRRQAQMEALGLPFKVDYMLDSACALAFERFTQDDFFTWVAEQLVRKAPGREEMPDLNDRDELWNAQAEWVLTKYLDHLQ